MPAILTHHLFGIEVHDELQQLVGSTARARDAFLLGNQGPDPLLCLKALPSSVAYKDIGTTMHVSRPAELLGAVHRHLMTDGSERESQDSRAFALGFLCHYLLDSIAHPLVYAQQNAICEAGVPGLPPERGGRIVHALIETELDEYMLDAKLGTTVATFQPHVEALRCETRGLQAISSGLGRAACDVYGLAIPSPAFAGSVRLYRSAQFLVDTSRNRPELPPKLAQLAGGGYYHFRAFAHSVKLKGRTAFANADHVPWAHPFAPGAVVSESFDELYGLAFEKALEWLPAYAQPGFDASACEALVSGINFYGEPVTR